MNRVDVGDINVDVRVYRRPVRDGVGQHQHRIIQADFGVSDRAVIVRYTHQLDRAERVDEKINRPAGPVDDEMGRNAGMAFGLCRNGSSVAP